MFCGGGGLSLGIEEAGFRIGIAVDSWNLAIENYNHNRKEEIGKVMDVSMLKGEEIKRSCDTQDVPLIIGGPPCPGYSMAGKRNIMDPRNLLVDEYYRIIEEVRPMYFIMENVTGMMTMKRPDGKTTVMNWIEERIGNIGYKHAWSKLVATSYGVGQKRSRIIVVGWRPDVQSPLFPPRPTHAKHAYKTVFGAYIKPYVTVRNVFNNIPKDAPNQDLVYSFKNEEYIEKVKKLKPGESVYEYGDSHRKLEWDKPAFTIKENHGSIAIHPEEIRMINLREAAALQDFPNKYEFIGDNKEIAKIIGNAVPRGLARAIAIEIMKAVKATGTHDG